MTRTSRKYRKMPHKAVKERGSFRLRGTGRKWGIKKSKSSNYSFIAKAVAPAKPVSEPWDVLKFVLMTEKCIRMIETENKLVFITNRNADKRMIKNAFEQAFGKQVADVNTVIDQGNRKKAVIRLKEGGAASDIAMKLGVI